MADPKGTYFSPTTPETGWATVLPTRPHKSYASLFAKDLAARRKADEAEEKAKRSALSKLRGVDVGKFHHKAWAKELEKFIEESDNKSSTEIEIELLRYEAQSQATRSVAKIYDEDVKWSQRKDVPLKQGLWQQDYTKKNYANPEMETAPDWTENPPNRMWFKDMDYGGAKYVQGEEAMAMVIGRSFDGYAKDDTEWKRTGWSNAPMGNAVALTLSCRMNSPAC